MKKQIILTIIIATLTLNFNAQTVTLNMATYNSDDLEINGEYIKDFNNDLDKYVGIWKWEEGNSSFTIKFEKIEMLSFQPYFNYYADIIIGRYKYVENGITIADNLNETYNGDYLMYPIKTSFNQSNLNELNITFRDYPKQKTGGGYIIINTTISPPTIEWLAVGNSIVLIDDETSIDGWSVPIGNTNPKILIKQ